MTRVYLVTLFTSRKTPELLGLAPGRPRPSVLASYAFSKIWAPGWDGDMFESWCLDSGAYTAHFSGEPITLSRYLDFVNMTSAWRCPPSEVFSLDVIGDHVATALNARRAWSRGLEVIPTFHHGSPLAELRAMARDYPKIALGGIAGSLVPRNEKARWLQECFAAVWPKPIHGLGVTDRRLLKLVPFHSVDSSSWEVAALRFGRRPEFGGLVTGLRGAGYSLRSAVDDYLRLERDLASMWGRALAELTYVPWGEKIRAPSSVCRGGPGDRTQGPPPSPGA